MEKIIAAFADRANLYTGSRLAAAQAHQGEHGGIEWKPPPGQIALEGR